MDKPHKELSVTHFAPKGLRGQFVRLIAPLADRIMGLSKLRRFYDTHLAEIHDRDEFTGKILSALEIEVLGAEALAERVPAEGSLIVVCNHPYGAMEGVILSHHLGRVRYDTKILANRGLMMIQELRDYLIYTQPLLPNDPKNRSSIRECNRHVASGGLLAVFPAGRVAYYQEEKSRVADGKWNRLPVSIAQRSGADVLPVHFSGGTSQLFQMLGRIYHRFRLLMLVREMFHLERKTVTLSVGSPISWNLMSGLNSEETSDFLRLQVFLKDQQFDPPWPKDESVVATEQPLGPAGKPNQIRAEIDALPRDQRVATFKNYAAYYGYHDQLPNTVREISRLREMTFRTMDEGSGEPYDTDKFDATYTHLFVCDEQHDNEIIAAYRMGETDRLIERDGLAGVYLSQMFDFGESFINRTEPCLEMGRSFIVPDHQRSFHALLLLWKGIGGFLLSKPKYRYLYGTVSLSKLYRVSSVALMKQTLVTPGADVVPHKAFEHPVHPEVIEYLQKYEVDLEHLSRHIRANEHDGKDIPILVKQYAKLGAQFHAVGIDSNFAATPGMLLSIHVPDCPARSLTNYFCGKEAEYIDYAKS